VEVCALPGLRRPGVYTCRPLPVRRLHACVEAAALAAALARWQQQQWARPTFATEP